VPEEGDDRYLVDCCICCSDDLRGQVDTGGEGRWTPQRPSPSLKNSYVYEPYEAVKRRSTRTVLLFFYNTQLLLLLEIDRNLRFKSEFETF